MNAVSRVPERSELALQAALEYAVASPSAELTLVMRAASACLPACLPSCLAKSGGEAGPVTQKRLNERRSRVAVEKGAALSSTIFGGQGVRMAPSPSKLLRFDLCGPRSTKSAGGAEGINDVRMQRAAVERRLWKQ